MDELEAVLGIASYLIAPFLKAPPPALPFLSNSSTSWEARISHKCTEKCAGDVDDLVLPLRVVAFTGKGRLSVTEVEGVTFCAGDDSRYSGLNMSIELILVIGAMSTESHPWECQYQTKKLIHWSRRFLI
jgi:hypothetical protein